MGEAFITRRGGGAGSVSGMTLLNSGLESYKIQSAYTLSFELSDDYSGYLFTFSYGLPNNTYGNHIKYMLLLNKDLEFVSCNITTANGSSSSAEGTSSISPIASTISVSGKMATISTTVSGESTNRVKYFSVFGIK